MKKNTTYIIFSALTTLLIFSYLFAEITLQDIVDIIRNVDWRYLAAFILLSLLGSVFRTLRFSITLLPSGYRPNLFLLFLITLVRNLFSDLLPARIGTASYIYMINSRLNIPLSVATNSFALSLLFDLLALGPLVLLTLFFAVDSLPFSPTILVLSAIILFFLTGSILWWLSIWIQLASYILLKLNFLPKKFQLQFGEFLSKLALEATKTKKQGVFLLLFILSVFVRLCKYSSLYLFLLGILIPLGFSEHQVNPFISLIGILSGELAASLPISGIAGFGAYEGAWALTFAALGFPSSIANLTAVSHHLFTQIYGYSLGAIAAILLALPWTKNLLAKLNIKDKWVTSPIRNLIVFLIGINLTILILSFPSGAQPLEYKQEKIPKLLDRSIKLTLGQVAGTIIFDSNRSGTFGIYQLNPDHSIQPLYDSNFHDMFPDPSPNGKWIVFGKTRSLSRNAPSEIWLMERNGQNSRKLVAEGTTPTFSTDNQTVYYESGRGKIMAYSLVTKNTKEIFPKKRKQFRGRQIVKPRIAPDGSKVAFTSDFPSRWHAWYAPIGKGKAVNLGPGCEPSWFPDNTAIVWIKRSGYLAGSGIVKFSPNKSKSITLKDDGPPFGHEYFPSISHDGRFLLYGASPADQHDHNSANYQIFIYDLNLQKTQRLTFDNATNRWPKILPKLQN